MNGCREEERHAAYYLALAEQARREWFDTRRAAWLDRLTCEHDNLRAALRWLADSGDAVRGLRLAGTLLRDFWTVGDRVSEGRAWLEELLALPQASAPTVVRARALDDAAVLALYQRDYVAARSFGEESVAIRREVGDRQGLIYSLLHLGQIRWHGENDEATTRALYEEGLAIGRELGNRFGSANSTACLGNLALDLGDYANACSLYRESLTAFREEGHIWAMSVVLENLAALAAGLGQPERALRLAGAGAKHREAIGVQLPPAFADRIERLLEPARKALSETAQAEAWTQGQAMTLAQAVGYALGE